MPVSFVVGSQWGDEGKGKIVDYLSENCDFVVRFNGGNNAGHTVVNKFGKFILHLIPCGVFAPKAKSCIGNGVVVDLEALIDEIKMLEKTGFPLKDKLMVSPRCHLIFPYHKIIEHLSEVAKGKNKIGTTGRGIGPVYADKISRNGIRIIDLLDKKQFSKKLKFELALKNKVIIALGGKYLKQKDIEDTFFDLREKIIPYVSEPFPHLQKALVLNKSILLEGANAVFLDNDWGTYPFVTSSTVLSGGANAGAGIPPNKISKITGIVKSYTTRVGSGPFPTEQLNEIGEKLRNDGAEFGSTTGRPRRCGWLDIELLRFATQINGFSELALTKIDVLDSFKTIQVCIGYTLNGKKVNYYDGDAEFLTKIKPVYKTLTGWQTSTRGIKKYNKLPYNAKKYIDIIEKLTGTYVKYISTGPKRDEIITR